MSDDQSFESDDTLPFKHRERALSLVIRYYCRGALFVVLSWVCNETDAQLIISKYKKNTMKRKRRASYKSEKIMCFSLRVLVSN